MRAEQVVAPAMGAGAALLTQDYHGGPVWLLIGAVTLSLGFGMLSSAGRAQDRAEATRISLVNAGALCVLAFATVFKFDMDVASSAMAALVIGLLGTKALQIAERYWISKVPGVTLTREELAQELGDNRARTQAAISEIQAQIRDRIGERPDDDV